MTTSENTATNLQARGQPGKYLTFRLMAEEYGIEILKVQEIIGLMNVTRVPKMPEYVRGIINLRGKLIPVIDLRKKFSLPHQDDTLKTCFIVVQVKLEGTVVTMGLIVDSVSEVRDIKEIEAPPALGRGVSTDFMLGLGKIADKVVMLLDVDRVMASAEMSQIVSELGEQQAA